MNIFIRSWILYTTQHNARPLLETTGSDAVVIAYSVIWLVLHSWLQRNKSVYRLDSRPRVCEDLASPDYLLAIKRWEPFTLPWQLLDFIDVVLACRTFWVSLSSLMQRAQVNVGSVLHTSTSPSCTPLQTTWTLEQYHHNCRLVMIYMKFCDVNSDV